MWNFEVDMTTQPTIRRFLTTALAIAAMGCGRSSPTAPAQTPDISGNWKGTISTASAGSGTFALTLVQQCLVQFPPAAHCGWQLSGTWVTTFANPAYSASGTVSGSIDGTKAELSLARRDPGYCELRVTATVTDGKSMQGPLSMPVCVTILLTPLPDSGSVSVSKVEGVAIR